MPWHVARSASCPASKPWAVILDADSSVVACHATEADAQRHKAALYANVPEASGASVSRGTLAAMTLVALENPDTGPVLKAGKRYADDASKWGLVPDAEDRSSWRLPLWYEGEEKPDGKLLSYALGRLSPDANPTLPVKYARDVRARVRAAWEALHPQAKELPATLRKAEPVSFDPTAVEGPEPSGVMIAFGISPDIADALAITDAGSSDITVEPVEALHVTLCFMGSLPNWPADMIENLAAVLRSLAPFEWPLQGEINGFAVLDTGTDPTTQVPQGAAVALVDVPGLSRWRSMLADQLCQYGFMVNPTHDFTPHVTLAYGPIDALRQLPQPPVLGVYFDSLMLCAGLDVYRFPFDGPRLATSYEAGDMPVLMKADEQRYTFAPLYVPDTLDAHKEWATGDDLQQMVWDYVRGGQRSITLQHVPGTVAGESVEIVCWPLPVQAELIQPDGTTKTVELPAGTIYQGVVWEPWAYRMVKEGKINGLSMGGAAYRTEEAPPASPGEGQGGGDD